jgi:hypothetical protein
MRQGTGPSFQRTHPDGRGTLLDATPRTSAGGTVHNAVSASPLGAPFCRIRPDAHRAGMAGGQDLLIAIFLGSSCFGSGTRISSTPAL